jgi:hypothetical protein
LILKKLKSVKGTYDIERWDREFNENNYLSQQIRKNASKLRPILK